MSEPGLMDQIAICMSHRRNLETIFNSVADGIIAVDTDLRVVNLKIDEDLFCLRTVFGDALNLGTAHRPDSAFAGIDVVSSETGCSPLEVRHVLVRMVCANGMTRLSQGPSSGKARYTRLDREAFRNVLITGEGVILP